MREASTRPEETSDAATNLSQSRRFRDCKTIRHQGSQPFRPPGEPPIGVELSRGLGQVCTGHREEVNALLELCIDLHRLAAKASQFPAPTQAAAREPRAIEDGQYVDKPHQWGSSRETTDRAR